MTSPGPTVSMSARNVRAGDVIFLAGVPSAVIAAEWETPSEVVLLLEDGTEYRALLDTQLDVTRPFTRHAETGDHDTP